MIKQHVLKLLLVLMTLSAAIFAEDQLFFFPYENFNTSARISSTFSGANSDVNAYLESQFPEVGSINVIPVADLAVSNSYKTSIFCPYYDSNYRLIPWFLVNYADDNTIISAMKFYVGHQKPFASGNVIVAALLSVSDSRAFQFLDNSITKYTISSSGVFTLNASLTVDTLADLERVDDTFPTLSSLYLVLPFSLSSAASRVNALIQNLDIEVFGMAYSDVVSNDNLKFSADSFASDLAANCSSLRFLILDRNTTDSVSNISSLSSSCTGLQRVFFTTFTPSLPDNSDITNIFPNKGHFYSF